jgi:hypothetical protein
VLPLALHRVSDFMLIHAARHLDQRRTQFFWIFNAVQRVHFTHLFAVNPHSKNSGRSLGCSSGSRRLSIFAREVSVLNNHRNDFLNRNALRKKRSILIKGGPVADPTPFDILTDRYVPYLVIEPAKACADLSATLNATLASDRETDSPVFKMLPRLPELDPSKVQTLPTDFAEEVARARAARSPGWLRLLASEVVGLRFQWPALRVLGQAQLELKDLD